MSIPPSQRPPVHGGGNGKYIAIAIILLLGMGGIVIWKFTQKPPAPPPPPTVITSAPTPTPPKFDDVPPPPPIEDAGPDMGPRNTGPAVKPCEVVACGGSITADTEASIQMLARQTRRKCYEPALAQDPSLTGHVNIKLKIAWDGEICSAGVDTADPGLQQVGECTARIIAAAGRVPAPRGCVNIKFPVNYKPQGK